MLINEFLRKLKKNKLVIFLGSVLILILSLGLYAPFFASSKPLFVKINQSLQFPLFQNLFYRGFYSHKLDLFCNILMLTLPLYLIKVFFFKMRKKLLTLIFVLVQFGLFYLFTTMPLKSFDTHSQHLKAELNEKESVILKPFLVHNHWQENAIDSISSSPLTTVRVNGKSLWGSLLFGIRYSVAIALGSTFFAFLIGITIGSIAGYFGKKIDLICGRVIEVWESMPTLFVLLLIISLSKEQSIKLIIFLLALFSWTSIARIVRLEVLKQKHLAYVDVLKGFGFKPFKILFGHILPNIATTILTLIPFAIINAMTYEAALSFLGMGDRQNCSIGLLLDEARMVYPMQPALFWPPALLLIAFLICLVWIGDIAKKILEHKERVI